MNLATNHQVSVYTYHIQCSYTYQIKASITSTCTCGTSPIIQAEWIIRLNKYKIGEVRYGMVVHNMHDYNIYMYLHVLS